MEDFGQMMKRLESLNIEIENASLQRIPVTTISVDVDAAKKIMKVIDLLEEDDDINNVYNNMEMTDEIENALEE